MIENYELKAVGDIVRLGNAVNRFRNIQMASIGLTATQGEVVRFVLSKHDKDLTAKDLMEHLNLSPSTVSGVVSRLCENGFLEKRGDETDLRRVIIVPGTKCLELEETIRQTLVETSQMLLDGMSQEEKCEFERLLAHALHNMNNLRYGDPKQ